MAAQGDAAGSCLFEACAEPELKAIDYTVTVTDASAALFGDHFSKLCHKIRLLSWYGFL